MTGVTTVVLAFAPGKKLASIDRNGSWGCPSDSVEGRQDNMSYGKKKNIWRLLWRP